MGKNEERSGKTEGIKNKKGKRRKEKEPRRENLDSFLLVWLLRFTAKTAS